MSDQMVPVASLEFTLEIQVGNVKRERSIESRPFVRYKTYSSLRRLTLTDGRPLASWRCRTVWTQWQMEDWSSKLYCHMSLPLFLSHFLSLFFLQCTFSHVGAIWETLRGNGTLQMDGHMELRGNDLTGTRKQASQCGSRLRRMCSVIKSSSCIVLSLCDDDLILDSRRLRAWD